MSEPTEPKKSEQAAIYSRWIVGGVENFLLKCTHHLMGRKCLSSEWKPEHLEDVATMIRIYVANAKTPLLSPQNTLAPCPQEWTAALEEGCATLFAPGDRRWSFEPEELYRLQSIAASVNASLALCPIKEGDAMWKFTEHVSHVSKFLSELYGIMIDPLTDGEMSVSDTCEALLRRARSDRETFDFMAGNLHKVCALWATGKYESLREVISAANLPEQEALPCPIKDEGEEGYRRSDGQWIGKPEAKSDDGSAVLQNALQGVLLDIHNQRTAWGNTAFLEQCERRALKALKLCANCHKPATCYGQYEDQPEGYACDDCCGHGNEDGHCEPISAPSVSDSNAAQTEELGETKADVSAGQRPRQNAATENQAQY